MTKVTSFDEDAKILKSKHGTANFLPENFSA